MKVFCALVCCGLSGLFISSAAAQVVGDPVGPININGGGVNRGGGNPVRLNPVGVNGLRPGLGVGSGIGYGGINGYYGYGYGRYLGYGGYRGGETAYQAQAQSIGTVLRAQGEYNEETTEAMKQYEQARSTYIDNQKKYTDFVQQRRQDAREYQEQEQARERERLQRFQQALKNEKPELLSPSEMTSSGELNAPAPLQTPAFAKAFQKLQDLFAVRARAGRSPEVDRKISDLTIAMQRQLDDQIHDMDPQDYIAARGFLERAGNQATYKE